MSDQNMFDDNNEPETPDPAQTDPFADKLSAIRNEKGEPKYKDVNTALDALAASQNFIEQLKSEKRQVEESYNSLKEDLEKRETVEDFVNRISPTAQKPQETPKTSANTEALSEEKIAELLDQRLSIRDQQSAKENNLKTVVSKLSEIHGDNAKAALFIKEKAKELQTTPAALKELAMSNPTMAMQLLGGVPKAQNTSPSQSTNVPPISPTDSNEPPKFERGIARGGFTNKELVEMFRRSKEYTNKRLGLD